MSQLRRLLFVGLRHSETLNFTTKDSLRYNPPLMTLVDALNSHSQWNPQKTALFCGDEDMSYGTLNESTTVMAGWFLREGLQPGDRVAIHWTNSIQVVQLLYALFKAGLVDEVHVTICPKVFGGRLAPTLADGCGAETLARAIRLSLQTARRHGDEMFLLYRVLKRPPP